MSVWLVAVDEALFAYYRMLGCINAKFNTHFNRLPLNNLLSIQLFHMQLLYVVCLFASAEIRFWIVTGCQSTAGREPN